LATGKKTDPGISWCHSSSGEQSRYFWQGSPYLSPPMRSRYFRGAHPIRPTGVIGGADFRVRMQQRKRFVTRMQPEIKLRFLI